MCDHEDEDAHFFITLFVYPGLAPVTMCIISMVQPTRTILSVNRVYKLERRIQAHYN